MCIARDEVPGVIAKPQPEPTKAGDWLQSLSSAERKEAAVSRGLFAYFPDALALVARHSVRANEKHNPGEPVHWNRGKSNDHADCILSWGRGLSPRAARIARVMGLW